MWKDIKNYEGQYKANEKGDILSIKREIIDKCNKTYYIPERILKPNKIKNGYLVVYLSKNGIVTPYYVHKIVAELFIPNNDNLPIINHIDGNKENCNVNNLEWTTYSKNNQHAYDTGLRKKGEQQYNAKLTVEDVIQIKKEGKYDTYENISKKYGVSKATIRDVLLNITWKNIN